MNDEIRMTNGESMTNAARPGGSASEFIATQLTVKK
jgi:hypothetical protein